MKNPREAAADLILQAIETANADSLRYAIRIAEQLGNTKVSEQIRLRLIELILNDPTPEKDRPKYDNDHKVEELTKFGAIREAVDLAVSKRVFFARNFYPLLLKVHEAGLTDMEEQLVRRFYDFYERDRSAENDPSMLEYVGFRWALRNVITPEVHRLLGFDIFVALKQREAELVSQTHQDFLNNEGATRPYFDLLFMYVAFDLPDEAERFRLFLRDQFLPKSAVHTSDKRIFEGLNVASLARLPDGFSPDGKPFYRNDDHSNFRQAMKHLIEYGDSVRILYQFHWFCATYDEMDEEFISASTKFLISSIPKFPPDISRARLYNNIVGCRKKYLSDKEILGLSLKIVEALKSKDDPTQDKNLLRGRISGFSRTHPELVLRLCMELPPPEIPEDSPALTFGLNDADKAKEYITLFERPEYYAPFDMISIPVFLKMKLPFPVAWIDEKIALAREYHVLQAEADLLLWKFEHRSLFAPEENADEIFNQAIEIIRNIDTDTNFPKQQEDEPNRDKTRRILFRQYCETGVEWKHIGLLHAAQALAFVGRIDEARTFAGEYYRAVEYANDLAQRGLLSGRLLGCTIEEGWKRRFEQAKANFLLVIADAIVCSLRWPKN